MTLARPTLPLLLPAIACGGGTVNAPSGARIGTGQAAVAATVGRSVGPLEVRASVDTSDGPPVSFDLTVTEAASLILVVSTLFPDDRSAPAKCGPIMLATPSAYCFECTIHSGLTGPITVQ